MAAAAKTASTLVASQSVAVGTPVRAAIALPTKLGGFLTFKITNGGSAPGVALTAKVFVAHNASLPSTGAEGTDWKLVYVVDGGTTASTSTTGSWPVPMGVGNLQIEFANNTTNAVTAESYITIVDSIA